MTNPRPLSPPSLPSHALLSVASHELRGPVGVARGYLRLLEQDPAQLARSHKAIGGAAEALQRVVDLLDEMGEYSRLMRGELHLDVRPASWTTLLDGVIGHASLPSTPKVIWQHRTTQPEGEASFDLTRVARALVVLTEALARAQTTDVSLSIAVRREDGDHRRSILEILTSASGPSPDMRPADVTRAGMGLALVLADATISAHDARLSECWQDGRWVGYRVQGLG